MDARTIRGLVLLTVVSLFCAGLTWAQGRDLFARSGQWPFSAQPTAIGADMDPLVLRRTIRADGQWTSDDYDVLSEGEVVGRIMKVARPKEPWMWTLDWDHRPWWGFEATREAAMATSGRTDQGPRSVPRIAASRGLIAVGCALDFAVVAARPHPGTVSGAIGTLKMRPTTTPSSSTL